MNTGIHFDESLLRTPSFNMKEFNDFINVCESLVKKNCSTNDEFNHLMFFLHTIELTSLHSTDNNTTIQTQVDKAQSYCVNSLKTIIEDLKKTRSWNDLEDFTNQKLSPCSICVFSVHVKDARDRIAENKVNQNMKSIDIVSVAGGFPMGLVPMSSRLSEVEWAISYGAKGIDLVIDRRLVICGKFKKLYLYIKAIKKITGPTITLKTILSVSELYSYENVYKAAMVAMMAGSDFVVTSTGKEAESATLSHGLVMCTAIKMYHERTKFKVGFKVTEEKINHDQAYKWFMLLQYKLGPSWIKTELFRIGTYGLFADVVGRLGVLMKSFK